MNNESFQCPYCTLEVRYEAVRCPHCQSDVSGTRLLFQKLKHLEGRIDAIVSRIGKIETDSNCAEVHGAVTGAEKYTPFYHNQRAIQSGWLMISSLIACIAIVLTHWLLLFVLNFNTIFLRVLTIFLPIIIGSFGACFSRAKFIPLVTAGFVVGLASVSGMLGVTAWLDGVGWFPTTSRDQKEAAEYVLAIWFGFSTGYFVFRVMSSIRGQQNIESQAIGNTRQLPSVGVSQRQTIFERFEGLVSTLSAMGSAGAALYSGLKTFFE